MTTSLPYFHVNNLRHFFAPSTVLNEYFQNNPIFIYSFLNSKTCFAFPVKFNFQISNFKTRRDYFASFII